MLIVNYERGYLRKQQRRRARGNITSLDAFVSFPSPLALGKLQRANVVVVARRGSLARTRWLQPKPSPGWHRSVLTSSRTPRRLPTSYLPAYITLMRLWWKSARTFRIMCIRRTFRDSRADFLKR